MTQLNNKVCEGIMEVFLEKGVEEGLAIMTQTLINEAMKAQRTAYLQADPYERSESRQDHSNGFKPKTLKTRVGALSLLVPQTRNGGFYPDIIEKGRRSEKALLAAIAEMFFQGVSTRNVTRILDDLCGCQISSTQVSRIVKTLDTELDQWRNRSLKDNPFLYLIVDARYEKVRVADTVRDMAVTWAIGIREEGTREVLGVSLSFSEAEIHWRDFLKSLTTRGLHGVTYVVSDDHIGLKNALKSVFPNVAWNRCHTHLARNTQDHVSKQENKDQVARDLRDILQAPSQPLAQFRLQDFIKTWQLKEPKLTSWAEHNIPEGFAVFELPHLFHKHLRTSNLIERINQELKRRSRVIRIFPNEASCLRLMTALLLETHEDWLTGRRYLPALNS